MSGEAYFLPRAILFITPYCPIIVKICLLGDFFFLLAICRVTFMSLK